MGVVTRSPADEWNTTYRPSGLMLGSRASSPAACAPPVLTLARSVVPNSQSRTNTSLNPLVSPATRFDAPEMNATYRPSPLTVAELDAPLPWAPVLPTLTRTVSPVELSWRNTSVTPLVSPVTRLAASDVKTM